MLTILLLTNGLFQTAMGFSVKADDGIAIILFKLIPGLLGVFCLFVGVARVMGWPI